MNMTKTEYPSIGETVYSGVLENGLRIFVIPKPGFSSYYAVFGTDYGGAMRRFEIDGRVVDTPAGVAHYLEHKMFDLPEGENALNILSANGADPNAFTSSSETCYYFRCTHSFNENLRMLLHFVSTPYFTPETVEKERGIIGQEIQMGEDSPGSAIYYNLLGALFDHHPIKYKVAGTIDSIAQISDKTLYDCFNVFYAPSNMALCVEGDVDPAEIFRIAADELPKECRGIPRADYGESEGPLPVKSRVEATMPVSAPQFLIGCKLTNPKTDILKQRLTVGLALRLMFGSSSSFYSRLYSEGVLTRDFDYESDYSAGVAYMLLGGESSDPDRILSEVLSEAERIRHDGFDAEYFSRTKKAMLGSNLRSFEDFDDVCLSVIDACFDGYDSFTVTEELESVTKEDCEAVISEYFVPERLAISIITPEG